MKAIVYRRYGGPEVLEYADVDRPSAESGHVVVRVRAASINAADYRLMRADPFLVRLTRGLLRPRHPVLGADFAGVVDEVGPGVEGLAVGDAVFGDAFGGGQGSFAEFVAVPTDSVAPKPEDLSFEAAAAVPLAGVTALQAVRDGAPVELGQSVLVQGAGGGVGTFLVQLAKARGATVTAVCGPGSVDLVASLGADRVLDYTEEDVTERGERYDVIFGVNGYHPLSAYKRMLAPGGAYLMVGGRNAQIFEALLLGPIRFAGSGKEVSALTLDDGVRARDLDELRRHLADGTLTPTIDRTYPLAKAADAIRYAERGHVRGKVILTVPGEA